MKAGGGQRRWWSRLVPVGVALSLVAAACGGGGAASSAAGRASSATPQRGGTLNYLISGVLANWDRGLDPASAGSAPTVMLNAIFDRLFWLGPSGKIQPGLATGYQISDGGRTVTISLRQGVKFQDGTPFNAQAVAWNINRDLATPCVCSPVTSWPPLSPEGITTPDDHTLVLHFTRPYAAVIDVLVSTNVNLVASPSAVQKMGERQFALKPVGAGPFQVVDDIVSSQLVLKRYDGYWRKGQPYLDRLIFTSIGNDQAAYQAILAGQAQATTLTTPSVITQASRDKSVQVTLQEGTSPWVIQLNTSIPPFDDKLAREAIYYATNVEAIRAHILNNMFPTTQSFTGPGGLFYQPKVPGYRTYNLNKARQIVTQLGGLKVDLMGGNDTVTNLTLQALQTQWQQAGIQTTIHPYDLTRLIQEFQGKRWQAALQTVGAFDPGVSTGLPFRFLSTAVYSGVHDPVLDQMMSQAAATFDTGQRAQRYAQIAKYISDQAYAPFLFAVAPASVAARGVRGPGLTTRLPIPSVAVLPVWNEAWISKG
ncbi:MAG TPA: ABC transporter substrate-binding protein [Candidatus Dormibacteraeota bacterium]|nr:ABC transporter substrate-binding protein [Candidatus Dormibacteraeota bacterium]